jgi:hypothetical protein
MSATTKTSPPPPDDQDSKQGTGTSNRKIVFKIPVSGDGNITATSTWSGAIFSAPNAKKTYVVDGVGLSPRYRRTTVDEARGFAQLGYTILDGDTYEVIPESQIPPGPLSNPSMPAAIGIAAQMEQVVSQENAIATGEGPATDAYVAAQVHREKITGS